MAGPASLTKRGNGRSRFTILERILLPKTFGGGGGDHEPGVRTVLPGSDAIFFRSQVTGPGILKKTQQHNQGFLKILSSAITLLKKSAAPDPGIFREKPHNPTNLRRKTMMIICGLMGFEEGAMRIFSDNCRHQHCAFKKIRSNAIKVFGKFPATQPDFFFNPKRISIIFKNYPITTGSPQKKYGKFCLPLFDLIFSKLPFGRIVRIKKQGIRDIAKN